MTKAEAKREARLILSYAIADGAIDMNLYYPPDEGQKVEDALYELSDEIIRRIPEDQLADFRDNRRERIFYSQREPAPQEDNEHE